ncbi:MAG: HAMP domain-containing histidine kinase [Verrucomicrobiales bacterium]|nr:HAMP domain-containing histidine kinase [Verrucomicrobiales bacterium]
MTVRSRLTIWYAGAVFVCGVLFAAHGYLHLSSREGDRQKSAVEEVEFLVLLGLPLALAGLFGGWWLTRRALDDLRRITEVAAKTDAENLLHQIPRSRNGDEFDRLTEVFNAMRLRLAQSFRQSREFTLHASHELKTPLTIMRAEVETAIRENSAAAPHLLESLRDILEEVDRLAYIVNSLTLLAKADAGLFELRQTAVQLDALVQDAIYDAGVLGLSRDLKVSLVQCDPVQVLGDAQRLRQVLLNLVDNAVKHNEPGGFVRVSLQKHGCTCRLQVENSGPGLAPDLQDRVFDRFFRGDTSRSRAEDSAGLGLAISRWIVESHQGEITFTSDPGKLTTVSIELPVAASSSSSSSTAAAAAMPPESDAPAQS